MVSTSAAASRFNCSTRGGPGGVGAVGAGGAPPRPRCALTLTTHATIKTRITRKDLVIFFSLPPGPHGHPNAAAALGTPPSRRELTLTPRLGFAWPRLGAPPQRCCRAGDPGVAAGAASL